MALIRIIVSFCLALQIPPRSFAAGVEATRFSEADAINAIFTRLKTTAKFFELMATVPGPDQANFKKLAEIAPNLLLPKVSLENGALKFEFKDFTRALEYSAEKLKLDGKALSWKFENVSGLLYELNQEKRVGKLIMFIPEARAAKCDRNSPVDCYFEVGGRDGASQLRDWQSKLLTGLIAVAIGGPVVVGGLAIGGVIGTAWAAVGAVILLYVATSGAKAGEAPKKVECGTDNQIQITTDTGAVVRIMNTNTANPSATIGGKPVPSVDAKQVRELRARCDAEKAKAKKQESEPPPIANANKMAEKVLTVADTNTKPSGNTTAPESGSVK